MTTTDVALPLFSDRRRRMSSLEDVVAALRKLRVHSIAQEADLQAIIARLFDADGIGYEKERKLGPQNRIDFLVSPGIGVEVKKGRPSSAAVSAQVDRYTHYDAIQSLVLVVERHVPTHKAESNGKPVRYIALQKLWGVSL